MNSPWTKDETGKVTFAPTINVPAEAMTACIIADCLFGDGASKAITKTLASESLASIFYKDCPVPVRTLEQWVDLCEKAHASVSS